MTRPTRTRKLCLGLLVTLIGIVAAQPLLRFEIVYQLDTMYHLQRVTQLDAGLRAGYWLVRFSPDLAYGFGYPILNYYAPLLYFLVEPFYAAGLPLITATALVCGLAFVASAWGKQLVLESANDPRLAQFVAYFDDGPQTPETNTPCAQGTSDTN